MSKIIETSAGVVIFRIKQKKILFLLLHYPSGHWDFVKGKVEVDESLHQTAIREAGEETGISDIRFLGNFKERIRYNFQYNGDTVDKKVIFFLGESKTSNIIISDEHLGYVWMDYEKAVNQITFNNSKKILAKARSRLSKTLKV